MRLFQLSSFKLPPLCMHLWVCSGAAFWGESPAPPCRAVQLLQGFLERGCARGSVWEEVPERSKPSGGSISLQKSQLGRFHSERKSCREPELFGGAWCLKEEQTNRTNNKKQRKSSWRDKRTVGPLYSCKSSCEFEDRLVAGS